MRITHSFILACALLGAGPLMAAGQTKYGVTVNAVEPAALAKVKTYVWKVSQPSLNKNADKQIVAAVDRELAARGFTKVPTGQSDVVVTYASVSRTDVDLKAKASKSGSLPEFLVGSLVVSLSDATNSQLLFRVRTDTPIEKDPVALEAVINAAVTAMFDKYPNPSKR